MNRVIIDLEALRQNIETVDGWMTEHGSAWTLVTKALCGHEETLRALQYLGVRSMADSRLLNLKAIESLPADIETWYLRLPHMPIIPDLVSLADVSLNSETRVIRALNEAARKLDCVHRLIVMIELGDLREGVLPGSLVEFYEEIFSLPHIEVLGIGANLGCLSGAIPNVDQLSQLALYRELLELKFKHRLPLISAGSSGVLPLLRKGACPKAINHFRIGEAVFLGTDLVSGGTMEGLRDDVLTAEAQIVEIREKSLFAFTETTSMSPFEPIGNGDHSPGERGHRAIVTLGQLDTDVAGLTPVDPRHCLSGASSDLSVLNMGDNPAKLKVGDSVRFRLSYGALVRLMLCKYVSKVTVPPLDSFLGESHLEESLDLPPILSESTT